MKQVRESGYRPEVRLASNSSIARVSFIPATSPLAQEHCGPASQRMVSATWSDRMNLKTVLDDELLAGDPCGQWVCARQRRSPDG